MQTIKLSEANARAMYPTASADIKKLLEDSFGNHFFKTKITDRVKTVEDACRELGIDYDDLHDECADEYKEAEKDIETFAEALREGKPASECFYFPHFYRDSSGGGFSCDVCDLVLDCSLVGARLRVDTSEKAIHMGKCLLDRYKIYHNG